MDPSKLIKAKKQNTGSYRPLTVPHTPRKDISIDFTLGLLRIPRGSISKSPFKIVQGFALRAIVDFVLLPPDIRISVSADSFAQHIHDVHATIRRKIILRIGPNAYILDPPSDMRINSTFNVEDLISSRGTFEPPQLPCAICSLEDISVVYQGKISISGYAVSGGGRGIERVDVSIDGGKTWVEAHKYQKSGVSYVPDGINSDKWAWILFKAEADMPPEAEIIAKAVDVAANVQPENVDHIWNLRGILNTSWHRVRVRKASQTAELERQNLHVATPFRALQNQRNETERISSVLFNKACTETKSIKPSILENDYIYSVSSARSKDSSSRHLPLLPFFLYGSHFSNLQTLKTEIERRGGERMDLSDAALQMPETDFERLVFFEQARKTAEATYHKNPNDADCGVSSFRSLLITTRQLSSPLICDLAVDSFVYGLELLSS
ncbi:hypothetical protein ACLOJK_001498 [Asimina triloba]